MKTRFFPVLLALSLAVSPFLGLPAYATSAETDAEGIAQTIAPLSTETTWLDTLTAVVNKIDDKVWGASFMIGGYPVPLLIILILFGGIFLTIRLGGMQFRHLPRALRYMFKNEKDGKGEVSSFGALCTALSATIGTGNIVGVATAVVAGGPGALFWMWLAALFGMATKYSEGLLAVKYRSHDPVTGHVLGGPFYYIERGMGKKWIWLAKIFAFFGVCVGLFGCGTFTQVNSITGAITNLFDPDVRYSVRILGNTYSWVTIIGGVFLTVAVGLVLIGGLKRIAKVSERVVPFMVVLYVVFALLLVFYNIKEVPNAFVRIIQGAFGQTTAGRAAFGGVIGALVAAMQKGIARGIFSNEAGLGSAPIAAAAAQTNEPVRQGLVSMTGTFLDTIVVCSMTGLALVIAGFGSLSGTEAEGAQATMIAFKSGLPFLPSFVVGFVLMISMVLLGFTTILGWDYYSERCLEYLTNGNMKRVLIFRWFYILAVFIGPYMTISAVWGIADIFNGLMAIPNMIALLALSGVIAKETRSFFKRLKNGEIEND